MSYRPPHIDSGSILVEPPHPASLGEDEFMRQCSVSTGRVSGPGGQHRNRVETAVFLVHKPTGVEAQGTERRSQIENRGVAIDRLRVRLAVRVRCLTGRDGHKPSALWELRRNGTTIRVNYGHRDYAALLAEALDVTVANHFDLVPAARTLCVSMSQLHRLLTQDKEAAAYLARGRQEAGLRPLRD